LKAWPVQDAKARFSQMLDAGLRDGPKMVTRRGTDAAVLVPMREWQRLQEVARPSLKELLLTEEGRGDVLVPSRGRLRRRAPRALTDFDSCICSTRTSVGAAASASVWSGRDLAAG
jgi:antitoxin Phd